METAETGELCEWALDLVVMTERVALEESTEGVAGSLVAEKVFNALFASGPSPLKRRWVR